MPSSLPEWVQQQRVTHCWELKNHFRVTAFLGFSGAPLSMARHRTIPPTPAHSPVTKTHYFKTSICLADLRHKAILYLPGTEDSSIGIMPASSLHPEQETLDDVHWSICCLVLMASLDTKRLSKESLEGNKG